MSKIETTVNTISSDITTFAPAIVAGVAAAKTAKAAGTSTGKSILLAVATASTQMENGPDPTVDAVSGMIALMSELVALL